MFVKYLDTESGFTETDFPRVEKLPEGKGTNANVNYNWSCKWDAEVYFGCWKKLQVFFQMEQVLWQEGLMESLQNWRDWIKPC